MASRRMTKTVLITGSPDRVASLRKAFQETGVDTVTLAELRPGTAPLDYYVQLGQSVPARGGTVVRRVHAFLTDGLLERSLVAERVIPLLAPTATVVLVAGNLPAEVAAPDDRAARLAMLRVLAHAMRADLVPARVRIGVVTGGRTDEQIVTYALSGATDPLAELGAPDEPETTDRSYEDWRIAVLGLAQIET
jgi:hypothetical protein